MQKETIYYEVSHLLLTSAVVNFTCRQGYGFNSYTSSPKDARGLVPPGIHQRISSTSPLERSSYIFPRAARISPSKDSTALRDQTETEAVMRP